ncbi:MAG: hypothetical protein NTX61_01475 [Bacteroidetes bacterium]|nr:hypothetical protein [Bacteroidota bacterium]
MKLVHLTCCSIACALLLFFSSCSSTKSLETKMIGRWNPVTVEDITPVPAGLVVTIGIPKDTAGLTESQKLGQADSTTDISAAKKEGRISRMVQMQMRSPVIFSVVDKKRVAEMKFPGKSLQGSWKFKKQGKQILIKETGGKNRKVKMAVQSLSDSVTVVVAHLKTVDLRIKYKKAEK